MTLGTQKEPQVAATDLNLNDQKTTEEIAKLKLEQKQLAMELFWLPAVRGAALFAALFGAGIAAATVYFKVMGYI